MKTEELRIEKLQEGVQLLKEAGRPVGSIGWVGDKLIEDETQREVYLADDGYWNYK